MNLRHICALIIALALTVSTAAQELPGGTEAQPTPIFTDVPEGHWAYDAVRLLAQQGIVLGYPDGTFGGNRPITRYEVAAIAARLLLYVNSLVETAALSAETQAALEEAAVQLAEVAPLPERIARLEQALDEAAALTYVERLERRIADLEAALNELLGEARFPLEEMEGVPRTVAEALRQQGAEAAPPAALPPAEPVVTPPEAGEAAEPKAFAPKRAYFGIAPGALTRGLIYVGVHAGYDRLLGPLGVVVRAHYNGAEGDVRLSLGVLARTEIAPRLDGYGGLSAGVTATAERTAALIEVPFGIEYYASETVGLFAQLLIGYAVTDHPVSAGLGVGLNLRF